MKLKKKLKAILKLIFSIIKTNFKMNYDNLLKNFEKCGDLYKILKIDPTADKKIIKKAYKDLALIYHPDKNKSHDASIHLNLIIHEI